MKLYRVFPYDAAAAKETDPGGAMFVPPPSELGRVANVGLYRELYFASEPEGAVAEVFGFLYAWYPEDFVHASGRRFVLSEYELRDAASLFDLNDTEALLRIGIRRPSQIVTMNRKTTQAWAYAVFSLGSYSGVSWWSRYFADWTLHGIWDTDSVRHIGPLETLKIDHPVVVAAADKIVRQRHPRALARGRRKP